MISSVGGWVGRIGKDTASSLAASHFHSNVSRFSPRCSPRVLDNQVINTVLRSPSDSQDSVVKSVSQTLVNSEDATAVVHKGVLVSLNWHWNGSMFQSWFHWLLSSWRHIGVGLDSNLGSWWLILAVAIISGIRIIWFSFKRVAFSIFEGVVIETSIAALVSVPSRAIN